MDATNYEQIRVSYNVAKDTTDDEPMPTPSEEEEDREEERQSPNLSMDEVRELLDEFEEILRS